MSKIISYFVVSKDKKIIIQPKLSYVMKSRSIEFTQEELITLFNCLRLSLKEPLETGDMQSFNAYSSLCNKIFTEIEIIDVLTPPVILKEKNHAFDLDTHSVLDLIDICNKSKSYLSLRYLKFFKNLLS